MLGMILKTKERIFKSDRSIFFVVSILFAAMFFFIYVGGDDVANGTERRTVIECMRFAALLYRTWSSRVVVNFLASVICIYPTVLVPVYMGVSMFVFLEALSLLFSNGRFKECNDFIACLMMMYPFQTLSTAGWASTVATYFGPVAFGFLALVPIKKRYDGKGLRWWEYGLYALSLVYGSNIEQMMIVILACYLAAIIYFAVHKMNAVYCYVMFLLSVGSCLFTLSCPGNYNRKLAETAAWFPTYRMLNEIDKADIGLFTTLKWLLFEGNLFVICICSLMAYLIWKRYKDGILRALSLLPVLVTVFAGPLRGILTAIYPSLAYLVGDIPYYGLVTVENRGNAESFGKYMAMGLTTAVICLEVCMLLYGYAELIAAVALLAAGTASRVAMGFSPTVYASNTRTFAVMGFCVIAVGVLVYSKNVEKGMVSDGARARILYAMKLSLLFSFLNLWFVISTVWRA